jgi:hypothetical protein
VAWTDLRDHLETTEIECRSICPEALNDPART